MNAVRLHQPAELGVSISSHCRSSRGPREPAEVYVDFRFLSIGRGLTRIALAGRIAIVVPGTVYFVAEAR
jgi:hypothetical protein